ncbi:AbrB/MazE/SpoVT family DNA-binding domain-containing protein [Saccharopolyspora sp. K220]|uniref:AbrB/MazE/SpoVT family DNA-binding domain-containing protein n=1 Tax=Saccharopolyspora soli TaxID=2926618 RepID=UPI001F5AF699|nr:AbrB/MazE/SpoVT family DNA-binding domain-containing protein [Saccharopolyspora soli]MCI2422690.1 AbrB/MazE/SpoVT family DNA-binding domain-containing protein [Saccharopolyspora soli]
MPAIPEPRSRDAVYGLAAVDSRGRVADHAVLRALGWTPGTRLAIRETHHLLIIQTDSHGVFRVTKQGHLRLPAPVRHCCDLRPGDRVLLTAEPARGVLVVHPPAVLDDMVADCHSRLLGGDLA